MTHTISAVELQGFASVAMPTGVSEQAALEAVLDTIAPVFEAVAAVGDERDGALLVVTDNAGCDTAVQFWRDALGVGLGLASPAAFPWCLANAPCATIARRYRLTGPNVTWLATLSDPHAFDGAAAWLVDHLSCASADGGPTHAWLVALHFGGPRARTTAWHYVAQAQGQAALFDAPPAAGQSSYALPLANALLRQWTGSGESIQNNVISAT